MARPQFTKKEEEVLALVRKEAESTRDTLLLWAPWVLMSLGVFLYGFYKRLDDFIFAGFIVTLGLLCRGIYHQIKYGIVFKQIIKKYEESCK